MGVLSPCWARHLSYSKTGWPKPLSTNDTDKVTCKQCIAALAKVVGDLLSRPVNWNCPWCHGTGKAYQGSLNDDDVCFMCQGRALS